MTIQEAAYNLLLEAKRPMTAMDLAIIALERGLVNSTAKRPAYSLAQTIEKNVRDGIYNKPQLKFLSNQSGRMIALPEWDENTNFGETVAVMLTTAELSVRIPADLQEQLQLATQSKIADNLENTVVLLLRRGLSVEATNIKDGLMMQIKQLHV